jgi:UDPglucose--hexose-1-phosphate uridylyltransferase
MSELRWNRHRGEWIVTATHRMDRTFLPPRDYCPLCPTEPDGFETEIPRQNFEIAVFENRFPSFHRHPPQPSVDNSFSFPTAPAEGICEVVVYTPQHSGSLGSLTINQLCLLIRVWRDRYLSLAENAEIEYVLIFENRGSEVGVTLHHPHGQIYGFTYLPPVPALELKLACQYHDREKQCLYCDLVRDELEDGRRIVIENDSFVAFVPFAARYPYEVHLYCRQHRLNLAELTNREIKDLAKILQSLVRGYDALFKKTFPYIMVLHQEPVKNGNGLGHLHFEFYPPLRDAEKLKYLAGCEQGAGTFINDSLPEEKAAEIRKVVNGVDYS